MPASRLTSGAQESDTLIQERTAPRPIALHHLNRTDVHLGIASDDRQLLRFGAGDGFL